MPPKIVLTPAAEAEAPAPAPKKRAPAPVAADEPLEPVPTKTKRTTEPDEPLEIPVPTRTKRTTPAKEPVADEPPAPVPLKTKRPSVEELPPAPAQKKTEARKGRKDEHAPQSDLYQLLADYGVAPVAKVCDKKCVRFLKALTPYNEPVLLLLDRPAWQGLGVDADDVAFVETDAELPLPASVKGGYAAAIDPSAAGVAIEQGGSLATLLREALESVPEEHAYRLPNTSTRRGHQAYPIMRVSDLTQAPELALDVVHAITQSLWAYGRKVADADLGGTRDGVARLAADLETYRKREAAVLSKVEKTYRKLLAWYKSYKAAGDLTPEEEQKKELVLQNIRVRQDTMRHILSAAQYWVGLQDQFRDMEARLAEDVKYLQGIERVVDEVMME